MIYITQALLLSIALALSDSGKVRQRKGLDIALVILLTFLPSCLAACRGDAVGTDTLVYGIPMYHDAKGNNFTFYEGLNPSFGLFFDYVSWALASMAPNVHVFLGLINALAVFPVAISLIYVLNRSDAYVAAFVYYAFLYPMTLNMIRQGISVGWVLLAISIILLKDGKIPGVACLIIAVLFHKSAAIALLGIPIIYYFGKRERVRRTIVASIVILSAIVLLFYEDLVGALSTIAGSYARYLNGDGGAYFGSTILLNLYVGMFVYYLLKAEKTSEAIISVSMILIVGFAINALSMRAAYFYRFAIYFFSAAPISAYLISNCGRCRAEDGDDHGLLLSKPIVLLCLLTVAVSILYYNVMRMHEVIPYWIG